MPLIVTGANMAGSAPGGVHFVAVRFWRRLLPHSAAGIHVWRAHTMMMTVRRWSSPAIIPVPLEHWLPRPIQAAANGTGGTRGHDVVRTAKEWIERHLGEPIDVSEMAKRADLSRPRFTEVFREIEGVPPWSYVMERRVRRACELLDRDLPASEAAAEAGFCDQSHMTRVFKRVTGTTPGEYRRDRTNVQDEG